METYTIDIFSKKFSDYNVIVNNHSFVKVILSTFMNAIAHINTEYMEFSPYRNEIGSLKKVRSGTCPDKIYEVSLAAKFNNESRPPHRKAVNYVMELYLGGALT